MIQIRTTAESAIAQLCAELGATAVGGVERTQILAAQLDLRRNLGRFQSAFFESLNEKVRHDLEPRSDSRGRLAATNWQSLSLVDDTPSV